MDRVSVLVCPYCNKKDKIIMPIDHCVYFYDCKHCGKRIIPLYGDCCIFCSHGSVPCPSKQDN